jgi:hypothetical protein
LSPDGHLPNKQHRHQPAVLAAAPPHHATTISNNQYSSFANSTTQQTQLVQQDQLGKKKSSPKKYKPIQSRPLPASRVSHHQPAGIPQLNVNRTTASFDMNNSNDGACLYDDSVGFLPCIDSLSANSYQQVCNLFALQIRFKK